MDPVDVLTTAVHAAQLIRSGSDPEEALAEAYSALGLPRPDDGDDPLAVRIARLTEAAGDAREKLFQFLSRQAGPLPLRPVTASNSSSFSMMWTVPMDWKMLLIFSLSSRVIRELQ